MTALIGRSRNASRRVFPPLSADLYSVPDELGGLPPDQQAARDLLDLANQDFSLAQRFLGWGLDAPGQVGRLLLLHKLGIEAELAGRWQRADHFWTFVQEQMRTLADRPDVWKAVAQAVADEPTLTILADPAALRQHLVDEVFIDTHCAFYNGHLQTTKDLSWQSRAFAHLDYIKGLLELTSLSQDDLLTVLVPASERRITLCEEARLWNQAMRVCTDLLEHLPDAEDYQDRLAKLHLESTLAELENAKSPASNLRDAATLEEGIDRLDQMREDYPYNVAVFEALGVLHHLRAVKLANGKRLSEAILAAQKALAHNPSLEQARETKQALVEVMQELQDQMKAVEAELARQSGARLNKEGARLRDEASRGLWPADTYVKSGKAKKVSEAFYTAQGRRAWRDIGLPEPAGRWDERARALLIGLGRIIGEPPDSPDQLPTAWDSIAADQAYLPDLDAGLICAYLKRRLFGGDRDRSEPATKGDLSPQNPPVMAGLSTERRRGGEPFRFWLFSGQDKRIKLQAVVAIVLILAVGWLTVQDRSTRAARNRAYGQVVEAVENQDYAKIVQRAEAFLAAPPLLGEDKREEQVRDLYDKIEEERKERKATRNTAYEQTIEARDNQDYRSIIEYGKAFLSALPLIDNDVREEEVRDLYNEAVKVHDMRNATRDEAYEQIVEADKEQDYSGVIEGAEKFLDAPPVIGEDKRTEEVREIYAEALVRWFVRLEGPLNAEALEHIQRYRTLVAD